MITDDDILQKLVNVEDATVERKVRSDFRDCLRTATAFSNSLPIDDPGFIFVGVRNDGSVENNNDTEDFQMKVSDLISQIYPTVFPQVLTREKEGKKFIVVIVRGSPDRPHFAGHSYIRRDSRSEKADEKHFNEFIAMRNSKTREILKWKNKPIT